MNRENTIHNSKSKNSLKAKKKIAIKKISPNARKETRENNSFRIFIVLAVLFVIFVKPDEKAFSNPELPENNSRDFKNKRAVDQESEISAVSDEPIIREEGPRERTSAIGHVGLDSSQMVKVAKNIYRVANGISEEYELADGITSAMYILRYFAEIGEFEMSQADILKLVGTFESLMGVEVDEGVVAIIKQIRKVKFGKREARYFSQFYSVQPVRGIVIDINEVPEDASSSVKEIERFVMEEGSTLFFDEVDSVTEKKEVRDFIKTPVKLLGVVDLNVIKDSLYQVHSDIIEAIDDYLEWGEGPAPAMIVEMRNMYVTVDTATVLKQIKFDFDKAYVLPGINLDGDAVPSLVLSAKAKLLKLKVSIDQ